MKTAQVLTLGRGLHPHHPMSTLSLLQRNDWLRISLKNSGKTGKTVVVFTVRTLWQISCCCFFFLLLSQRTNLDLTKKNTDFVPRLSSCLNMYFIMYLKSVLTMYTFNVFFYLFVCLLIYFKQWSVVFLILCRPQLISDKGGIEITSSPLSINGKVVLNIELLDTVYVVRFQIVNNGQKCIHFTFYTALHRIRCFTLVDERRVSRVSPLLLCPGKKSHCEWSTSDQLLYTFRWNKKSNRNTLTNILTWYLISILLYTRNNTWLKIR